MWRVWVFLGVLSVLALRYSIIASAQGSSGWPCLKPTQLLVGRTGQPVWVSSKFLKSRALKRIAPQIPSSVRAEGAVVVDVLIDTSGNVACVRTDKGHPLLKKAAMDAARQWTFRPLKQRDKPVMFFGHLEFRFSN